MKSSQLFTSWSCMHLQISDLGLDSPWRAKWFPKWICLNSPGKCMSIHSSVWSFIAFCRDLPTDIKNIFRIDWSLQTFNREKITRHETYVTTDMSQYLDSLWRVLWAPGRGWIPFLKYDVLKNSWTRMSAAQQEERFKQSVYQLVPLVNA